MTESTSDREKPQSGGRKDRLAQALRDNLRRRKMQARERRKAESEAPAEASPAGRSGDGGT